LDPDPVQPGIRMDKRSGTIAVSGSLLDPSLTRGAFLDSPMGQGAKVSTQNEPWCSYSLPRVPVDRTEFAITIFFFGEQLRVFQLADCDPRFGTSWDDWSEEKELARKAAHAAWLKDVFDMPVGAYRWGRVESEYDEKGGGSSIFIMYGRGFQSR
jgi:hypothetical protein